MGIQLPAETLIAPTTITSSRVIPPAPIFHRRSGPRYSLDTRSGSCWKMAFGDGDSREVRTYPKLKKHIHVYTDLNHKASHSDRILRVSLVTDGFYLTLPGLITGPLQVISQNELGDDYKLSRDRLTFIRMIVVALPPSGAKSSASRRSRSQPRRMSDSGNPSLPLRFTKNVGN